MNDLMRETILRQSGKKPEKPQMRKCSGIPAEALEELRAMISEEPREEENTDGE